MASIGRKHSKCMIAGCKGRRPVWGYYCKTHRLTLGQTPPPSSEKKLNKGLTLPRSLE